MLLQRPLYEGCSGKDVRRLQDTLAGRGIYRHEVDGEFGYKTRQAVECVQRLHKLDVDGIAGRRTWKVLTEKIADSKAVVYTAGDNDDLDHIARTLGTTPTALARANSIRMHSLTSVLPGQTICAMPRKLLYIGCGHLKEKRTVIKGAANAGPIIDVNDDSSLITVEGTWGFGIPIVRLNSAKVSEGIGKAVKNLVLECQAPEVVLVLPMSCEDDVKAWHRALVRIRTELGRTIKISIAVPIRLDKDMRKPGIPVIPIHCIKSIADFVIAMVWSEPNEADIPDICHPAPYNWVKSTIRNIALQIDSRRLMLGCIGSCIRLDINKMKLDWVPYSEVNRVLRSFSAKPQWHDVDRVNLYQIRLRGSEFKYLFEDKCSIRPKAALVDALNLKGLVIFDGAWAAPSILEAVENTYMISI